MIHALATELADKGHFYPKCHFLWMGLAKGDLGMCFEGPHHLPTSPLTEYLFLSFCFTDNGPWSTNYSPSHTLFLLLALPCHTFFFSFKLGCLTSLNFVFWLWMTEADRLFFCSVPHVKSHKGKGSILKSTQEISWFYWLNHVIYNMYVNGILFHFLGLFLRFQFNCNLPPPLFLTSKLFHIYLPALLLVSWPLFSCMGFGYICVFLYTYIFLTIPYWVQTMLFVCMFPGLTIW